MTTTRFATVVNCFDGRVQDPVATWVKTHAGVAYVDVITVHAPERVLTEGSGAEIAHIHDEVRHSMRKHDVQVLVIVGHTACEGNPVTRPEQIAQLRRALALVASWDVSVPIVGLLMDAHGEIEQVQMQASAT